ncbi:MAG: ribosome maturation factor RimP [Elusimicrobia bacterium]|nr:ribosome maturation factor RimP [Elusimicrobiota bacterium]
MTINLETIEKTIAPLLEQEAVELVDLRYIRENGRYILRFFLDKSGGITLDDCEYLSNRIGSLLDMTDALTGPYVLEVSSPGLDRVIKKEKDFERFKDHRVKIHLKHPNPDGQRNFLGILKGLESGVLLLEADSRTLQLPLEEVEEARLDPEIDI